MAKDTYRDEIFILRVQNWQTADKYAVCFSRNHGRISFISYGARYQKNIAGRLIQPFARLDATLVPLQKWDTLRQCESIELPASADLAYLAYGAVIAECTEYLTGEKEEQEEIYELLLSSFRLLGRHNKRLVTLSTLCKLLTLTGFGPQTGVCTSCLEPVSGDGFFSMAQGGFLCPKCATGEEKSCSAETARLFTTLTELDFGHPGSFSVKGRALMELEEILEAFIMYQTDKPLKSLAFLAQVQL